MATAPPYLRLERGVGTVAWSESPVRQVPCQEAGRARPHRVRPLGSNLGRVGIEKDVPLVMVLIGEVRGERSIQLGSLNAPLGDARSDRGNRPTRDLRADQMIEGTTGSPTS